MRRLWDHHQSGHRCGEDTWRSMAGDELGRESEQLRDEVLSGSVTGLETGSPAALAGLQDGDHLLAIPTYDDLASLAPGQTGEVTLQRGAEQATTQLLPGTSTALVPSWHAE